MEDDIFVYDEDDAILGQKLIILCKSGQFIPEQDYLIYSRTTFMDPIIERLNELKFLNLNVIVFYEQLANLCWKYIPWYKNLNLSYLTKTKYQFYHIDKPSNHQHKPFQYHEKKLYSHMIYFNEFAKGFIDLKSKTMLSKIIFAIVVIGKIYSVSSTPK